MAVPLFEWNSVSLILLISDDELEIERNRDLLTHMGFDVYVANSPTEASFFCQSRLPQVIIADIEMADGGGFEAISVARRLVRNSFVIATTRGEHMDLWSRVSSVFGADTYVVGPLTVAKIEEALPVDGEQSSCY